MTLYLNNAASWLANPVINCRKKDNVANVKDSGVRSHKMRKQDKIAIKIYHNYQQSHLFRDERIDRLIIRVDQFK